MSTPVATTETTRIGFSWYNVPDATTSLLKRLKNSFAPMTVTARSVSKSVSPTLTTITRLEKSEGFSATVATANSAGSTALELIRSFDTLKGGEYDV